MYTRKKTATMGLAIALGVGFVPSGWAIWGLDFLTDIPVVKQILEAQNLAQNTITAAKTAEMLTNQAKQLKSEAETFKKNFEQLGEYKWRDLANLLQQVDDVSQQGQSLSYSMKDMDAQFRSRFPDFKNTVPQSYQKTYDTWQQTTMDTIKSSFKSIGINTRDLKDEQTLINKLRSQGASAQGEMQILQTSTEIAAENVNQLQKLQRTVAAQANAQNAYMAKTVSQEEYEDARVDELFENMHVETKDHSREAKEIWDFEAIGRSLQD